MQPGPEIFPVGARVVSERWGEGTVQRYDGDQVTVLFDDHGYRESARLDRGGERGCCDGRQLRSSSGPDTSPFPHPLGRKWKMFQSGSMVTE